MWYNVRCKNEDGDWVIYGIYCFVDTESGHEAGNVMETGSFIHPESVTWCGYSFWLGAESLQDEV